LESLIIFVIFIVFSIVRSLGGQGRQQQQPGRPMPPGMPRQPQQPQQPQRRVPMPQPGAPVFEQEHEYRRPAVRLRQIEHAPAVQPEPEIYLEPLRLRQKEEDTAYDFHIIEEQAFDLRLDPETLLLGVVFSEVLGQPRARRRHIFPVRPVR